MTTRILPAVGDIDAARALSAVTGRLPGAGAAVFVGVFGELLDHVAGLGPVGVGGDERAAQGPDVHPRRGQVGGHG
ncbi:hypothetical protein ABZ819_20395 [Streptomyces venezuelae]|uniref:hypothetical protein n=1 Tax=Streptomyces venezuelae TaxID=54571 RepID=UPI00344A01B0